MERGGKRVVGCWGFYREKELSCIEEFSCELFSENCEKAKRRRLFFFLTTEYWCHTYCWGKSDTINLNRRYGTNGFIVFQIYFSFSLK